MLHKYHSIPIVEYICRIYLMHLSILYTSFVFVTLTFIIDGLEMKVAIITGASGSIGRSIVSALGKAGCSVVVNYRSNQRSAEEICHTIQEFGVKAIPFKADCSLPEDVSRMVDFTRNEVI